VIVLDFWGMFRLPGKGNSIAHGARPVHLLITMTKWIRISRLSIEPLSVLSGVQSGTAAQSCKVVVLKLRTVPSGQRVIVK